VGSDSCLRSVICKGFLLQDINVSFVLLTTASQIIFVGLTFIAKAGEKIFHYLFAIALLVGSIAYFAMASDLAFSVVTQVDQLHMGHTRQIFWAKYVYWVVSWPVAIIALGLISGVAWATIAYNIALAWVWYVFLS
jgi:bacteriorhodopsin